MYKKTTHDIEITVTPIYSEENSAPHLGRFIWSYKIGMENHGNTIVQLMTRYWHITDAKNYVREVQGPGVVGEQPVLRPGDYYEYSSNVDLATESGFMEGKYIFQQIDGDRTLLEVAVPAFALDLPHKNYVLN